MACRPCGGWRPGSAFAQDAPEAHQFVGLCDCNVTENRDTTDHLVKGRITRPLRLETNYTGRKGGSGIDYVMGERASDFRIAPSAPTATWSPTTPASSPPSRASAELERAFRSQLSAGRSISSSLMSSQSKTSRHRSVGRVVELGGPPLEGIGHAVPREGARHQVSQGMVVAHLEPQQPVVLEQDLDVATRVVEVLQDQYAVSARQRLQAPEHVIAARAADGPAMGAVQLEPLCLGPVHRWTVARGVGLGPRRDPAAWTSVE